MRLYTDDYFHIGTTHLGAGMPCQDYALSRSLEDGSMSYAIVSDGCSKGGRTDVGARIVSHTAEVAIRDHWKRYSDTTADGATKEIDLHQQVLLTGAKVNLGLERRDLLATCAYAFLSLQGGFVHLRGDGVMAFVYRDNTIAIWRYDWTKNMPSYPAYFEDNFSAFINDQTDGIEGELIGEEWIRDKERFIPIKTTRMPARVGVHGVTASVEERALPNLAYVALFTDGVTQIDGIDWKDAVLSLLSFKNVAGSFAKRRMISFIKSAQKQGKGPLDDIAYAVIRVEESEVTDDS